MGKKKLSISVEEQDDGGFRIHCGSGHFSGESSVAETPSNAIQKVSTYLKKQLGGN